MTTTKKRVNISLSSELEKVLTKISERDEVPQATKAAELIRIAIEIEEDQVLDVIASKRDIDGVKFIPHKKAWV